MAEQPVISEDLERFIDALTGSWVAFEDLFIPSHCIAGSVCAYEAARYFGFKAEIVACDCGVFNALAWAENSKGNHDVANWPEGAWSVGASHSTEAEEGRYNSHVVCLVEGVLVDLSFRQFNRPEKAILAEPMATAFRLPSFEGDGYAATLPEGAWAVWMLRREERGWKQAPDYRKKKRLPAGQLIRGLKEVLR